MHCKAGFRNRGFPASHFSIIDVNAVSNVSEDNTEMFHFDLMKEIAQYIAQQYKK